MINILLTGFNNQFRNYEPKLLKFLGHFFLSFIILILVKKECRVLELAVGLGEQDKVNKRFINYENRKYM